MRFRVGVVPLREGNGAAELMVVFSVARGWGERSKDTFRQFQMREVECAARERDLVGYCVWIEVCDLAPPFEGLGPAALFGHLRHGATGGEVIFVELEEAARDQNGVLEVAARGEMLNLPSEILLSPAVIKAQAAESDAQA